MTGTRGHRDTRTVRTTRYSTRYRYRPPRLWYDHRFNRLALLAILLVGYLLWITW